MNPPPYDALISCVWFGGAIKKSLHRYKFRGRSDLHSSFSKIMISRLEEDGFCYDAVVPVPLSAERLKERGYNQSALLAKDIARHFQAPYYDTILIRKKHTLPQTTLPHKLRKENLRGAFALKNPEPLLKKRVLLIDDIFTTGATVREASKALSKAADSIAVCTIAASAYGKNITFPEDS